MKTSVIHTRVDPKIKKKVETVLQKIGLTTSDAINLLLYQIINTQGIPFALTSRQPNAESLAAFAESEKGEGKTFSSVKDLMDDLRS